MIGSFLLNPLLWLTLIVVGHCTSEHWLFWVGLALCVLLFARLAMKVLGKGMVAQAKALRARR